MKVYTKEDVLKSLDNIIESFDDETLKKLKENASEEDKKIIDETLLKRKNKNFETNDIPLNDLLFNTEKED